MSIEFLKKLRTFIAMSGIVASTTILSGCGADTIQLEETDNIESDDITEEDKEETIPSEYLNDKDNFIKHKHIILEIGGINYIIRGCQPEIGKVHSVEGAARLVYSVYDKEGNILINGTAAEYGLFDIDTYLEEKAIQEVENDLIENGAKLYKGLGN